MLPSIETRPSKEIKNFQEQKLAEQLIYLNENSAFYQELFKKNNIDISKIKTLEDLALIPPTTKDYLQNHNDEFICVPRNKIIDYSTTSGTLGDPVTFVMTDDDLDRLAYFLGVRKLYQIIRNPYQRPFPRKTQGGATDHFRAGGTD